MRATREPRILFYVPAQSFHLALDVVVTDDQLRGQVSDGVGQPKPFSGWLGLIAALDGLLDTTDATDHRRLAASRDMDLDKPAAPSVAGGPLPQNHPP
jgi:hypothetical protein